jgi:putative hydrolase of the HAD superfamily
MPTIRAAIFDIGGVLTSSPVSAIRTYAEGHGVDWYTIGPMIADPQLAWSRWERSEISGEQFMEQFDLECRDAGLGVITAAGVQGAAFGSQVVRPEMVNLVKHLRDSKVVRLGAITNNVLRDDSRPKGIFDLDELFEVVIESAKAGIRKPDPRIYEMACEMLQVEPPEAVFLDDLGINLKGARALGIHTIKVDHTLSAIDELESALGVPLPRI